MLSRFVVSAIFAVVSVQAHAEEAPLGRLELSCVRGDPKKLATPAPPPANGAARTVSFDDQVNLWIDSGQGQIQLPRAMEPSLHGGDDGWFKLKEIRVYDRAITATVALSIINNAKVRIDRYSGLISVLGRTGTFTGKCQKYDPAAEKRIF